MILAKYLILLNLRKLLLLLAFVPQVFRRLQMLLGLVHVYLWYFEMLIHQKSITLTMLLTLHMVSMLLVYEILNRRLVNGKAGK